MCVDAIFSSLQLRASFMFPVREQHIEDFVIRHVFFFVEEMLKTAILR